MHHVTKQQTGNAGKFRRYHVTLFSSRVFIMTSSQAVVLLLLFVVTVLPSIVSAMTVCTTPAYSRNQHPMCECTQNPGGGVIVDCSHQQLEEVPAKKFPANTTEIDLQNNIITRIATNDFLTDIRVEALFMDHNKIEVIEVNAFRNLAALRRLTLSHNRLTEVDQGTFYHLVGLHTLDLSHNKDIASIASDSFFLANSLDEIMFDGFKMICTCETKLLQDWAEDNSVTLTSLRCENFNNRHIGEVPDWALGNNCTVSGSPMCYMCQGSSLTDCVEGGPQNPCTDHKHNCQVTIAITSGHQNVTSHCQTTDGCISGLRRNPESCVNGALDQTCILCCSGSSCDEVPFFQGYKYTALVHILFTITEEYNPALDDHSSSEYKELSADVTSRVQDILEPLDLVHVQVIRFGRSKTGHTDCLLESMSQWDIPHGPDDVVNNYTALLQAAPDSRVDQHSLQVYLPGLCSAEVTSHEEGTFSWPDTEVERIASVTCPYPMSDDSAGRRQCIAIEDSLKKVVWLDPDLSECGIPSNISNHLLDLADTNITEETLPKVAKELETLTEGKLSSTDIHYSTEVLEDVLTSDAQLDQTTAGHVLETFDNLLQQSDDNLQEAQDGFQSVERALRNLDLFSESLMEVPPDGTMVNDKISVGTFDAAEVDSQGALFHVRTFESPDDKHFREDQVSLYLDSVPVDVDTTAVSLRVPASVLAGRTDRIQFVAFTDDTFFRAMYSAYPDLGNSTSDNQTNSLILAATFGGKHQKLSEPISITFRHTIQEAKSPQCVFWDFEATPDGGAWSSLGCHVDEHMENEYTVCKCDHLTYFGLIMDIYGNAAEIPVKHQMALTVISYVGCAVSLTALLLTIITYASFSKLLKDTPSKLLMNLCVALALVMVFFFVVTHPNVVEHDKACKATAALLHYFLLAAWVWMAVEAFYMYLALIQIFNTYMSYLLLKCCLVGWGVPALIVIVTVAVDTDNYESQADICWLSKNAFYGACVAPILLILVGNFLVFGAVIRQLRRLSARSKGTNAIQRSTRDYGIKMQLRGAVAIAILLGLTWIFAIFAFGKASLAFSYLFAIFNSFQGLFIFIFYCIMKKEVKMVWREKWTEITSTGFSTDKSSTSRGVMYGTSQSQTQGPTSTSETPSHLANPKLDNLKAGEAESGEDCNGSRECLNGVGYIDLQADHVSLGPLRYSSEA